MPTQQFDGASLEEVLDRVERRFGADARIMNAQKVKKGGLGGFFSQEWYEVEVEYHHDMAVVAPKTDSSFDLRTTPSARTNEPTESAHLLERTLGTGSERSSATRAKSVLDLAEQINQSEEVLVSHASRETQSGSVSAPTDPAPTRPHNTPSFATMLEEIREKQMREHEEKVAARIRNTRPTLSPPPDDEIEQLAAEADSEIIESHHEDVVVAGDPEVVEAKVEEVIAHTEENVEELVGESVGEPVEELVEEPIEEPVAEPVEEPIDEHTAVINRLIEEIDEEDRLDPEAIRATLIRKGVPKNAIPDLISKSKAYEALVSSLSRLPKAPPLAEAKGTVVAVIGAKTSALTLAKQLADQLSADSEEIIVATQAANLGQFHLGDLLSTPEEARQERRSWRRRTRPTIVVVETDNTMSSATWAESMLEALEPNNSWAIVDAGRKSEDLEAWTDGLGGVDAVAIENIESTMSPASVLGLGIPVARINGKRATASLWASLILKEVVA